MTALLEEQAVHVQSGGFWNCLSAARQIAALLLSEGRRPWIARLRKTITVNEQTFHAPLIPRVQGVRASWTTHYVCCCEGMAYDPVAGRAVRLEMYTLEVFGEHIEMEIFAPYEELSTGG